jgi:hypothetical protein
MADDAIPSTNNGIQGVKPLYQDAYMDTFREMMKEVGTKAQEEYTASRIVGKEYSTVYLGAVQYAMATAAQLAKDEKESRYKLENMMDLDRRIKQEQIKQLQAETYFKNIQAEQIIQSVYDNRQIKIIDSLSDMVGMILNGGTQSVPTSLLDSLVAVVNVVKTIPKLSYPTIMIDGPIDIYDVVETAGVKSYNLKTNVIITGSVRDVAVGETVSVQINGATTITTVTADLTWSVTVGGVQLEADDNRTLYAIVSASDSQGNTRVSMDAMSYSEKPDA